MNGMEMDDATAVCHDLNEAKFTDGVDFIEWKTTRGPAQGHIVVANVVALRMESRQLADLDAAIRPAVLYIKRSGTGVRLTVAAAE